MLDLDDWTPDLDGAVEFVAGDADGYQKARVLMRHRLQPIAFVEASIVDGRVRVQVPARTTLPIAVGVGGGVHQRSTGPAG